jgi:hypothetical protein
MTRLATVPPTPPGVPVLGSALDLRRDILRTYERARRAHGDVVRFVIGPPGVRATVYALFHPDAVRRVLASEAHGYRKDNRFYQEVCWALGDGLLNSQDETWLRQRRFVQPLFTRRRIAGYAQSMAEEAGDLTRRWRELSAGGNPIDLHAEMSASRSVWSGGSYLARTWSARSPWSATRFPSSGNTPGAGVRPVPRSAQLADPIEPSRPARPACRLRGVRRADCGPPRVRREGTTS